MCISLLLFFATVSLIQCDRVEAANPTAELRIVAERGDEQRVKKHLQERPNVDAKDNICGRTALIFAAAGGHHDIVKMLLDEGAKVDTADDDNSTPLMGAAYHGHEQTVRLLLDAGADVDAANVNDWTALIMAAKSGRDQTVRVLLGAGADREKRTYGSKQTAEQIARENGHTDVADMIRDWSLMVKSAAKT